MENEFVHIQIRIKEELRRKLQEKCKNEDLTVSQWLRKKIADYLQENDYGHK